MDLMEQNDAYRFTMADLSMVFGGRDVVTYYRAKLRESMRIKSEMITICRLSYPIKRSNGCQVNVDSHSLSDGYSTRADHDGSKKRTILFERMDSGDTAATGKSEDSIPPPEKELIHRKKSVPRHRCADTNLKLTSVMKKSRYFPNQELKCVLQLVSADNAHKEERVVRFRKNIEVSIQGMRPLDRTCGRDTFELELRLIARIK